MTNRAHFLNDPRDEALNGIVYVTDVSDFPAPVGNDITLENNILYRLTNSINTGVFKFINNGLAVIDSLNETRNTITTELTGTDALFSGDVFRLRLFNIAITTATPGQGNLFDIASVTSPFPTVIAQQSTASGFNSLGTIDGAGVIMNNVGFVNNSAGMTLSNNTPGLTLKALNFTLQSGDHITITGNSNFLSMREIAGAPSTGDSLFDISGATTSSTPVINDIFFNGASGGDTGLELTITSDTTLNTIYQDVIVDSSSGPITVTLPALTANRLKEIDIKKKVGAGAPVTIVGTGGDTVNSASSLVLEGDLGPTVRLKGNTDDWGIR